MSPVVLIDTGPLMALLDPRAQYHAWALEQMAQLPSLAQTCEAVIVEAFHLLRRDKNGRHGLLELLANGKLTTPFALFDEIREVQALIERYENVPMSLADACLVRMSEQVADCVVFTLDQDFHIYRRNRRQRIPLLMPPAD